MDLKERFMQEVKLAMKNADKPRLSALRMISAEFKQIEVDERCNLDEDRMIKILQNMKNQRVESSSQYHKAGRDDLVAQENFECTVIGEFLPEPLSAEEILRLAQEGVAATEAKVVSDIARVMEWIAPHIRGRASTKDVGAAIRKALESL